MTPSLAELTRVFARIGWLSFGGPAAQIALMHREIVDRRGWVEEDEYLSALSFCMLLPGPEAMQLATWIGWRSHGTLGGLISGLLFVLPGATVVLALSAAYALWGGLPLVAALFLGLQAAVIALVIEALLRIARRALKSRWQLAIAAAAFLALFAFTLPFPIVILVAALLGAVWGKGSAVTPKQPAPQALRQSIRAVLIWGTVWLLPLGLLGWLQGGLLWDIAIYFSQLAVLTFGGAYAVLAWMVQDIVQVKGWLTTGEMMAGLGLAETTPGPLILVTEFVGFLAGWKSGGWGMALAGAGIALWMTFAPCFLWIFAGAPQLARLTGMPRLSAALAGISAAVVGVIAHLSLWFALHLLFAQTDTWQWGPLNLLWPMFSTLQIWPAAITALASYLLIGRHWPLAWVLGIAALAGGLGHLI